MRIERHTDLHVYRKAFDVAMKVFEVSRRFPKDETYSLTDQVRRSSRSVKCGYLDRELAAPLYSEYEETIRMLVDMINHSADWLL